MFRKYNPKTNQNRRMILLFLLINCIFSSNFNAKLEFMECQNDNETLINQYDIAILEKTEFLDLVHKHTLDQMLIHTDYRQLE